MLCRVPMRKNFALKILGLLVFVPLLASADPKSKDESLKGESMGEAVFAMDHVVDCNGLQFALSDMDGYQYDDKTDALFPLSSYHFNEHDHSYSFDTVQNSEVIHHKILIGDPHSERYGRWYTEKKVKGINRVKKGFCVVEQYWRESLKDEHVIHEHAKTKDEIPELVPFEIFLKHK
jgi:hypothetical protein